MPGNSQEFFPMCMSSPNIPAPPPPPQEVKQPDSAALTDKARRNRAGMAGGSLLTGPSGIASGALTTGKTSLLGQ
jgi:hypothetical protein